MDHFASGYTLNYCDRLSHFWANLDHFDFCNLDSLACSPLLHKLLKASRLATVDYHQQNRRCAHQKWRRKSHELPLLSLFLWVSKISPWNFCLGKWPPVAQEGEYPERLADQLLHPLSDGQLISSLHILPVGGRRLWEGSNRSCGDWYNPVSYLLHPDSMVPNI